MPIASITSQRTGQTFEVDFKVPPTDEDIDEAVSEWDTQFYQREGLSPSIAQQGAGASFARGAMRLGTNLVEGVGTTVGGTLNAMENAAADALDQPRTGTFKPVTNLGQAIGEAGRDFWAVNPANPTARIAGEGVGQAATLLATAGAAAPLMSLKAALTTVPLVMGGALGMGQGIQTAEQMGIDNPYGQLAMGGTFAGVEALTERLGGIGGKAAAEMLQSGVKAGLKQVGKTVGSEAIEEPISGTLQDIATVTAGQAVADPSRPGFTVTGYELPSLNPLNPQTLERRKQEAIGGAAGGLFFGGLQMAGNVNAGGDAKPGSPASSPPGNTQAPSAPGAGPSAAGSTPAVDALNPDHTEDFTVADLPVVEPITPAPRAPILGNVPDAAVAVAPEAGTANVENAPILPAAETAGPVPVQAAGTPVPVAGEAAAVTQQASSPRIVSTGKPNGARVEAVIDFVEAADLEPLLLREVGSDQTRDRANNRGSSEQVAAIATQPDPHLLGDSPVSSMGAPVVDDVILAGNGRAEGLIQGYQGGGAGINGYRANIVQQAEAMGRPEVAQMKQPVMIRRVQKYVSGDRRAFVKESNPKYATLQETVAESALLDAEVLGDLSGIEFTEAGSLTSSSLQQVATKLKAAQRGVNATTGGKPDVVEATRRVQQAALAKLSKEHGMDVSDLSGLLETDTGRRTVAEVTKAAPKLAALEKDLGLGEEMLTALQSFSQGARAVSQGLFKNMNDWAENRGQELIRDSLSPEAGQILEVMIETVRTPTKLRELFDNYLEAASNEQDQRNQANNSGDIFGDTRSNVSGKDIIRRQMAGATDTQTATPESGSGQGDGKVTLGVDSLLQGTESTRPMNQGETVKAQDADPLAELFGAKQAGEAEQAQGKIGFKNLDTSGKTAGFVNGEILSEAADLIRSGITDFANWSRAMLTRFGRGIQDYLSGIWQQVVASLPNTAAQNVRLGGAQGTAPVGLSASGAVINPNETRSRFASPNAADRVINGPRTDVQVAEEAAAWLSGQDAASVIEAFQTHQVPLSLDAQEHAAGLTIARLSDQVQTGKTEAARMLAHVQSQRMARIWTKEYLSADPARALRQRGVVNNTILQPIAPILAAQEVLIDRAEALGKARFDGGWTALVQKINDLLKQIEKMVADTAARNLSQGQSTPSLTAMLNALRKKMYPGMDWTEIFTDLPSTQKARQLAIYDRLLKDERLQGLTQDERIALTNELDKAWMRERRTVFNRELTKAGILGEKAVSDRLKVKNAMPKLLRLINLGMFNSEMFREVIAPEYKLKVMDAKTAAKLRGMAEAAYAQPEGVLRARKLGDLLTAMQSATGSTLAELVNNYWTAAVLSGTRTQFDTWMAGLNGLGTNLIQASALLARGQGKAAVAAHAAWWRGLIDGTRESVQILAKGDYSVLKRFTQDVNAGLNGESGFRPLPLGESLWKNGNTFQKYAMAPVMIWTGRLMAAADHVNNTATTAGAMAVARALHPEFYGSVTFSALDQANARAQALREVTGGTEPTTAADKATVRVRVRELLYGSMRETERLEANEIGDMAAFQNDPTGVFGTVYAAMKAGLGTLQRGMETHAQDMEATKMTRAMMGLMAGSLHGLTGTRFMRFGFNFGAELTRYVPGTALIDTAFSGRLYGKDAGPMQKELLIGKNVVGLMLGSTLAAMFLGADDDKEGWQMEGDWSMLSPQQVKERMSAGMERLTLWKRDGDKVRRVSYKQWPTMGLFAVVGGMLDEKRHKPAQWAQHGTAGHLLRGMGTGLLQIKNVSAVRNLVELFGGTRFAGDPSTGIIDDVVKVGTNFAGGMIPTALKDVEVWTDSRNFKAEGWLEELQRATPIARRFVNDGRPQLNLLGEEVKLQRAPWSRGYTSVASNEASRVLGALLGRGLNLPQPSDSVMVYQNGVKVPLEKLGREKVWQYEKAVGTAYKAWLSTEGAALLTLPVQQADKVIAARAAAIKRQALAKVAR